MEESSSPESSPEPVGGSMSGGRRLMAWLVQLLPWIAFGVAAVYLLRLDRDAALTGVRWPGLVLASSLVLAAYAVRAVLWWRALAAVGVRTSLTVAVASEFRSVLMKFLPGKIWTMVGRASEVALASGSGLALCTSVSIGVQLLTALSGLLLGAIGVAAFEVFDLDRRWLLLFLVLLAALLWFSLNPRRALALLPSSWRLRLAGYLPKELTRFPDVVALMIAGWLLMGAGFAFFFEALGRGVGGSPVLLQPLANAAGIAAVFAPAGLGVREGATAGYLLELGLPGVQAVALVVWARLWIVVAELLLFLIGTVAAWSYRRQAAHSASPAEPSVSREQVAG